MGAVAYAEERQTVRRGSSLRSIRRVWAERGKASTAPGIQMVVYTFVETSMRERMRRRIRH